MSWVMLGRVETTGTPKGGSRINPGLVDFGEQHSQGVGESLSCLYPAHGATRPRLETAWEPGGPVLVEVVD